MTDLHCIRVVPEDILVPARDGEAILDAMLRHGCRYRYACKRGGCGECKVDLLSGEVIYDKRIAKAVLSDDERAAGVCLSCRAVATSDIVIRPQDGHLAGTDALGLYLARVEMTAHARST